MFLFGYSVAEFLTVKAISLLDGKTQQDDKNDIFGENKLPF